MEFASITRELFIDAAPAIVYDVISTPEHLREWWPDDAEFTAAVGGTGTITFGDPSSPDAKTERITIVQADPPRRFAFRWVHGGDDIERSLLVTFDLEDSGTGTLVRFCETGFRERGWEEAVLEQAYAEHVQGWNHFLPKLVAYAPTLAARS